METDDKDLGDKKFNNSQKENSEQELNEGFSGENIPDNYNPSGEKMETRLRSENETDENGNDTEVRRARHPDGNSSGIAARENENPDNSAMRNQQENRDRNYDTNANRYPPSHPENKENRGNINLDEK